MGNYQEGKERGGKFTGIRKTDGEVTKTDKQVRRLRNWAEGRGGRVGSAL